MSRKFTFIVSLLISLLIVFTVTAYANATAGENPEGGDGSGPDTVIISVCGADGCEDQEAACSTKTVTSPPGCEAAAAACLKACDPALKTCQDGCTAASRSCQGGCDDPATRADCITDCKANVGECYTNCAGARQDCADACPQCETSVQTICPKSTCNPATCIPRVDTKTCRWSSCVGGQCKGQSSTVGIDEDCPETDCSNCTPSVDTKTCRWSECTSGVCKGHTGTYSIDEDCPDSECQTNSDCSQTNSCSITPKVTPNPICSKYQQATISATKTSVASCSSEPASTYGTTDGSTTLSVGLHQNQFSWNCSSPSGSVCSANADITVVSNPSIALTCPMEVHVGDTVSFPFTVSGGSGAYTDIWSYNSYTGYKQLSSTDRSFSVTFDKVGTYTAHTTVNDSNKCGEASNICTITVTAKTYCGCNSGKATCSSDNASLNASCDSAADCNLSCSNICTIYAVATPATLVCDANSITISHAIPVQGGTYLSGDGTFTQNEDTKDYTVTAKGTDGRADCNDGVTVTRNCPTPTISITPGDTTKSGVKGGKTTSITYTATVSNTCPNKVVKWVLDGKDTGITGLTYTWPGENITGNTEHEIYARVDNLTLCKNYYAASGISKINVTCTDCSLPPPTTPPPTTPPTCSPSCTGNNCGGACSCLCSVSTDICVSGVCKSPSCSIISFSMIPTSHTILLGGSFKATWTTTTSCDLCQLSCSDSSGCGTLPNGYVLNPNYSTSYTPSNYPIKPQKVGSYTYTLVCKSSASTSAPRTIGGGVGADRVFKVINPFWHETPAFLKLLIDKLFQR